MVAPRVDRKATAFMPQPITQGAPRNAVDRQPSAQAKAGAMTLRRLRLEARR